MAEGVLKDGGEDSDVLPKGGNTFTPDMEVVGGGEDVEIERIERVYK